MLDFGCLGPYWAIKIQVFRLGIFLDLGLRPMKGFGPNLENWAIFGLWVFNGILDFWIIDLASALGQVMKRVKRYFTLVWDT